MNGTYGTLCISKLNFELKSNLNIEATKDNMFKWANSLIIGYT